MKTVLASSLFLLTACAVAPASNEPSLLLIGNKGEDTVSFVNLDTGLEIERVPTSAKAPHEIAVSPNDKFAAVVNYGSAAIDILDIASREIVHTYDLGENENPHGIIWQADDRIFATTEGGKSIVILSGGDTWSDRTLRSIKTHQDGTHMLAVSQDGKRAYTVNMGSGTVSLIDVDAGRVLVSNGGGDQPEGIDLAKNDSELWISARGGDVVYIMDAKTLKGLGAIKVGKFPLRLAVSPDGKKAVTSNLVDGSLSVIDVESRKVERTLSVSGQSDAQQVTILFSDDGSKIYVAETGTDTIAELDFKTGQVLRRLSAGRQGDGLAIVPGTK